MSSDSGFAFNSATSKQRGFQFLLASLLLLLVVVPFLRISSFADVVTTLILFIGIYVIRFDRRILTLCIVLAALGLIALWSSYWIQAHPLVVAGATLELAFFVILTTAILSHVLRAQHVTRETIAGAICVYLLIGIIWGNVFFILQSLDPGSFTGALLESAELGATEAARGRISHFSYYSLVTLSTLGYGDIAPVTRPARSLAALEAIFGQLYLAILIARLVSQHIASSGSAGTEESHEGV